MPTISRPETDVQRLQALEVNYLIIVKINIMKTKTLLSTAIVFLWFSIFLSLMLPAKAQTEIQYTFKASLEDDGAFMSIVLKAGSICRGIQLERSTDSLHFEQISEIKGICGRSSSDVPYSLTDIRPVPTRSIITVFVLVKAVIRVCEVRYMLS